MIGFITKKGNLETSTTVKWLRLCASTAMGMGSIPGQETKIPHATPHGQKIIKKGKFGQDMHTERTLCKDKGGE